MKYPDGLQDSDERSFQELARMTVPTLGTAEQFVVGVFRCWDAFQADPDPALAFRELGPVFAYMGVLGALCAVDRTFHTLRQHRLRALAFDEVDSAAVGQTEARFLCGLASLQRGDARKAAGVLAGIVSRPGIPVLVPPLARIAAILDVKGHRLPPWRDIPAYDGVNIAVFGQRGDSGTTSRTPWFAPPAENASRQTHPG